MYNWAQQSIRSNYKTQSSESATIRAMRAKVQGIKTKKKERILLTLH